MPLERGLPTTCSDLRQDIGQRCIEGGCDGRTSSLHSFDCSAAELGETGMAAGGRCDEPIEHQEPAPDGTRPGIFCCCGLAEGIEPPKALEAGEVGVVRMYLAAVFYGMGCDLSVCRQVARRARA